MVEVVLTRHLFLYFQDLADRALHVDATTVAEAIDQLERLAPGIGGYIRDETGRLRLHVSAFIGNEPLTVSACLRSLKRLP